MATTPVMKMTRPWTPELLPEVQRIIEEFILTRRGAKRVLEVGSGWSTIWFALMGVDLHSCEHDEDWFGEVSNVLRSLNVPQENYDIVNGHQMDWWVSQEPIKKFDLVLIDCVDEQRLSCLFASLTKVKDDGWIVVDDSHWDMFKAVPDVMYEMGYIQRVIHGEHVRKTGEKKYHETSIYTKGTFDV